MLIDANRAHLANWMPFVSQTNTVADSLAFIRAALPSGKTLFNHATTSVGYASSSEPVVRVGLGSDTLLREVEITWPSGTVQRLKDVAAGSIVDVAEP